MAPKLNGSKEEFTAWLKALAADTNKLGVQYVELYHYLLHAFTEADSNYDGHIDASEFDAIIEKTAFQPRKYGYAPTEKDLYKSDSDRIAKRTALFEQMDHNRDGVISFDEFMEYFHKHIVEKTKGI